MRTIMCLAVASGLLLLTSISADAANVVRRICRPERSLCGGFIETAMLGQGQILGVK